MIISCTQCNKKFEIESVLIPDEGRLLQCSSCNNKWFFKKKLEQKIINKDESVNVLDKKINYKKKIIKEDKKYKKNEKIRKVSFLNFILVSIISFIAIIIVIDTFKQQIGLIIPNVEFILNNLYETLTDIILFFKDLF